LHMLKFSMKNPRVRNVNVKGARTELSAITVKHVLNSQSFAISQQKKKKNPNLA